MKYYILILLSSLVLIASIKRDIVLEKLLNRYEKFSSLYHIQKVYIHTDKNIYKSNENIWFKFYLMDDLHRLDTVSKIGYVELIGPEKNIIEVRILKLKHGIGIGDFSLSDSLASGMYLIRGYTNLMKNFNEKFFFKKIITIKNPEHNYLSEKLYLDLKSLQSKKNKLKIQFNLSGKKLIANKENLIYVHISDYLGNAKKATILVKENTKIIKEVQSDSLGFAIIRLIPQENKKYKLIAISNKAKASVSLGKCQKYGYQMDISQDKNFFKVKIFGTLPKTNDKQFKTVYILAERNGKVYFTSFGQLNEDSLYFRIIKRSMPKGIVHFILFNGKGEPVAEQSVFNEKIKSVPIQIDIEKIKTQTFKLTLKTDTNIYATSSIAITSTDVHDKINIINYLSLKADLPNTKTSWLDAPNIFDYVKTFKWQRYTPEQIWINTIDSPKYKIQKSLIVKGQVTKLIMDLPVKNTLVTLTVLNAYNDQFQTFTDSKGYFYFTGLDYQDTIMALVEAQGKNGSNNVLVYINKYDTIPANYTPMRKFKKIRLSQLNSPEYKEWSSNNSSLHSQVDQVIYMDEIETSGYNNIFDILKGRVPGYFKNGDNVYFRGPSSITQSYEPLYLLDNMPVDKSSLENLNMEDIERIEIIKNTAYSVIYGSRGSNGVIAVYTKRGHYIQKGYAQEIQPGFYTPQKFKALSDSILLTNPYSTYLWNSQLLILNGKAELIFHLPKEVNNIKINIQGVDIKGKIINFNKNYTLKQ